jgi:hypothetical protein
VRSRAAAAAAIRAGRRAAARSGVPESKRAESERSGRAAATRLLGVRAGDVARLAGGALRVLRAAAEHFLGL